MSSRLASLSKGVVIKPQINLFIGNNKVGKSTIACAFPNTVAADIERGTFHLDVVRDHPSTMEDLEALIGELRNSAHNFEAFALDSAEAIEKMINTRICTIGKVKSVSDIPYGGGYQAQTEEASKLMEKVQDLNRNRDMTVNIVAHTQVKSFTDPTENVSYDRHIMRCTHRIGDVFKDLSDNIFFCTKEVETFENKKTGKHEAYGDGKSIMYTEWRPAFDAGNRLNLPFKLDLTYEALKEAMENSRPKNASELIKDIQDLLAHTKGELKDIAVKKLADAAEDTVKLQRIKSKLTQELKTQQ